MAQATHPMDGAIQSNEVLSRFRAIPPYSETNWGMSNDSKRRSVPRIPAVSALNPTNFDYSWHRGRVDPIDSSGALKELIPNSELVELGGFGHVPTVTRPREVYEAILNYFLPLT